MANRQSGPLFGARLPFIQQLANERQYLLGRAHEGLYHWLGHYQQMMVLQAGIAGVVVPVLYSQSPDLIDAIYLRRAVMWFGISLGIGVLIIAISKWVTVAFLRAVQGHFAAQDAAIGTAEDDEAAIAAALRQANQAFEPQARRWARLTLTGAVGNNILD